mmetsp:Transcript_48438/g.110012  ORF Transcript_48438/g.110012 Transcript_48438/m.110012 type:complete len:108 (-) Transcript_48438:422-745(-)
MVPQDGGKLHSSPAIQKGQHQNFKGIAWVNKYKSFAVHIKINGQRSFLGRCIQAARAARLYDACAAEHGLPLNFPAEHGQGGQPVAQFEGCVHCALTHPGVVLRVPE